MSGLLLLAKIVAQHLDLKPLILEPATLFPQVASDFCRNLTIRYLVNGFPTNDTSTDFIFPKTFLQLAIDLTRTEYRNTFRGTNVRDHLIIVSAGMACKLSVSLVICRAFFCVS
jgi:hypothetical protein